jgi:hypothetical protein
MCAGLCSVAFRSGGNLSVIWKQQDSRLIRRLVEASKSFFQPPSNLASQCRQTNARQKSVEALIGSPMTNAAPDPIDAAFLLQRPPGNLVPSKDSLNYASKQHLGQSVARSVGRCSVYRRDLPSIQ